jgi:outer membrane protein
MKKERTIQNWIIALILMWLPGHTLHAQSDHRYSLDELISIALKNNELIKNGQIDVSVSELQVNEARSALMPKLDFNGQYLYYSELPSQYAPASAFGGPEGEYTKMTLSLPQTVSGNLQSSVNLFNKVIFTGLKTARVAVEASRLQLQLTEEDIIYNVSSAYYSMQVLEDNLSRLNDNILNLEKTVGINESLKSNELVSDNVHNRLLINLENLRNQYEMQKLSYHQYETALKYLLNLRQDEELKLQSFNSEDMAMEPEVINIMNRSDIKLQEVSIRLSEYDKKNAMASFYPVLTGGMSYGYSSYYNEFAPARQLNNDWISSQSFSLSLKIPIVNGFQRLYKVKQKQLAIEKNRNTLSLMKGRAEKEIDDAMANYTTSATQLKNNRKSLDLADALFTSAQHEFENGLTSTTELLNAQNDLSNARNNFSTALLNLKLAELSLKKASGNLRTQGSDIN